MVFDDQADVINALLRPETYGKKVTHVNVVHSHISILFFAGDLVYKLKRAVLEPTVDFSTPEKRKMACISEMKRSAIYAPRLILGIKPVKRLKNGKIKIGGKLGEEVDTVLVEKRIPSGDILGNFLPSPIFDRFEMMDLAEYLFELHSKAKSFYSKWGVEVIRNIILQIENSLRYFPDLFDMKKLNTLTYNSMRQLVKNKRLVKFRQKSGRVKKCHGDLSLSNIAYVNKKFLLFSPMEYGGTMDTIDTLYDLSFLTMDLEARGQRRLSNILFNHYMAYMNDIEGVPLMPLYQSMHAAFKAASCARTSTVLTGEAKLKTQQGSQRYFELACKLLDDYKPVIIACGGLSGSGKSRIAREISAKMCPAPGGIILRDDVIKKQITGLVPHQKFDKTNDSPAFQKIVYEVLRQQAETAVKTGSCVVVDAMFDNEDERKAIADLARRMKVPFIGLWMDAPLGVRKERVRRRKRTPSDVRKVEELESQLTLKTGKISWHKINTNQIKEETIEEVVTLLKKYMDIA